MMNFTMNDLALLVIALLIGWILGLMMSGRGKFKRLWQDERVAHRTGIKDRDARLEAANARIVELERQRPAPVATPAAGGLAAGTAGVAANGMHGRDDLSRISGISQREEVALNEAGYHRYSQIAAINAEQEATLEARLGLTPGTIARDDWRGQALALERGESKPGLLGRLTGSR
ncbi:putative flap endonuclease-1-like 5' DNA nuclease [Sphingobium olei]